MIPVQARNAALAILANEKELALTDFSRHVWLGYGFCVGMGWATWREGGDDLFGLYRITDAGRDAYKEFVASRFEADGSTPKR